MHRKRNEEVISDTWGGGTMHIERTEDCSSLGVGLDWGPMGNKRNWQNP